MTSSEVSVLSVLQKWNTKRSLTSTDPKLLVQR